MKAKSILAVTALTTMLSACTVTNTEYVSSVPSSYTYTVGYASAPTTYWNSGYYYPSYGYSRTNIYGYGHRYPYRYHGGVRRWR